MTKLESEVHFTVLNGDRWRDRRWREFCRNNGMKAQLLHSAWLEDSVQLIGVMRCDESFWSKIHDRIEEVHQRIWKEGFIPNRVRVEFPAHQILRLDEQKLIPEYILGRRRFSSEMVDQDRLMQVAREFEAMLSYDETSIIGKRAWFLSKQLSRYNYAAEFIALNIALGQPMQMNEVAFKACLRCVTEDTKKDLDKAWIALAL